MTFEENLKRICKDRGTTPTAIMKKWGLSTSKVSAWYKGSLPKQEVLIRLAEELNCIVSATTKERLDELERDKTTIEGQIAREEMKKPLLTEERIRYWLTSFKNGDRKDKAYQRKIIDTLVNSVYVYDEDDGGKRIVLTFNLSGNNTLILKSSDIGCYAPPNKVRTNTSFFSGGFAVKCSL